LRGVTIEQYVAMAVQPGRCHASGLPPAL